MQDKPKRSRRWLRLSLRTLLIVLTIACIWLAVFFNGVRRQAQAVKAIEDAGGLIGFDYQFDAGKADVPSPGPPWLRWIVGDEAFRTPVHVELRGAQVTDAFLEEHTGGLSQVAVVYVDSTQVTDAGIVHVTRLRKADGLALFTPQMTDAALVHIGQMEQLTSLLIDAAAVTDAGVRHLASLEKLDALTLHCPKLTPAGVRQLAALNKLRYACSLRDPQNESPLRALDGTTDVEFIEMPLADAVEFLGLSADVKLDVSQLTQEQRNTPITITKTNVPLSEILHAMLRLTELGYYLAAGTIVIAPRAKAEKQRAGYYAFRETFPDAEQVLVDW